MAAGMSTSGSFSLAKNPFLGPNPVSSLSGMLNTVVFKLQQRSCMCFVVEGGKSDPGADNLAKLQVLLVEKETRERLAYIVAALISSLGLVSMTVLAVYYRFSLQMEKGEETPCFEMFGTIALSLGAAVTMELMSRWVHKALWHASLWHMHESHHKPREGAFELNDVFAIMNAVPAIALLAYGVFQKGLLPGICFAALHHLGTFKGVPYGLFLGPKEVEDVGGHEALEIEISRSIKSSASRASV